MLTRMKGEINSNTIIVGDFNTSLTLVDRPTKQKINEDAEKAFDKTQHPFMINSTESRHRKNIPQHNKSLI